MRAMLVLSLSLASLLAQQTAANARACSNPTGGLGVSRIVEIDVSGGPLFGSISKRKREPNFLKPKEVVLTFDDGPVPWITGPILKTLDEFCTKATFFAVGRMAVAYPATLKKVLERGHTLGAHTWSHPLNLNKLSLRRAKKQIEKGFAAVALAAGKPIAPFFRFPGLSDSRRLLDYLQNRGIGSFTVDVVSDDSYISSPARLAAVTLRRVEQHKGGILLFHDIKRATARALPVILRTLQKRGYKIVHLKPKKQFQPLPNDNDVLASRINRKLNKRARGKSGVTRSGISKSGISKSGVSGSAKRLAVSQTIAAKPVTMSFYGTIGPGKYATMKEMGPPVTRIAPQPRQRVRKRKKNAAASRKTGRRIKPQKSGSLRDSIYLRTGTGEWDAGHDGRGIDMRTSLADVPAIADDARSSQPQQ